MIMKNDGLLTAFLLFLEKMKIYIHLGHAIIDKSIGN